MSGPGRRKTADIEDTFRDFWNDRPVRPRRGGKVAGVAAALGDRYGIDPVLVRVAFVVGAFYGGAGIVLYLLGWLALPRQDPDRTDGSGSRAVSGPMLVVLVLLLIPGVFALTDFEGMIGLGAGLAALYLLHRHYAHRGRTPAQPDAEPQTGTADAATSHTWVYPAAHDETASAGESTGPDSTTAQPPSWDPLGAAPFAWDLPDPAESEPRSQPDPPRRRRSVTLITLALALIAGGVAAMAGLSLTAILTIPLGVLGLGMLAGAFLRGGRGLIAFAIPLAAVAMVANVLSVGPWRGVDAVDARPATLADVRDRYTTSVGRIGLDLTDLEFTDRDRLRTAAHVGMGEISVRLPENVDATVRCSTDRGQVDCLDERRGGANVNERTTSVGADGPGGGEIVLDLHASTGHVEVTRG